MIEQQEHALILAEDLEVEAMRKFSAEQKEQDPFGKRLLRNGGFCYFNAAARVRKHFGLLPCGGVVAQKASLIGEKLLHGEVLP